MNLRDSYGIYIYQNDKGFRFRVKLTASVALAGGFELDTNTINEYPLLLKHSKMRMIGIYHPSTSKSHLIPIAFSNNVNYRFGGELSNPIAGLTGWKVSDRFRERF